MALGRPCSSGAFLGLNPAADLVGELDDAPRVRVAAEDDEVDRVVHVEGDPAADPVDAAVDEVPAVAERVLDLGLDPYPPSRDEIGRSLGSEDRFGPELEDADPLGVGEDEADSYAWALAQRFQLHFQPDRRALLEVVDSLPCLVLDPGVQQSHLVPLRGGADADVA